MRIIELLTVLCLAVACTADQQKTANSSTLKNTENQAKPKPPVTPIIVPRVVKQFPHDTLAFTQGLSIAHGIMYESTGQYGVSDVRIVDLQSGRVLKRTRLDGQYFGEGSVVVGSSIYVLTWLNQTAFVYGIRDLVQQKTLSYNGEGWGITTDGDLLYMSNGSEVINVRNSSDFQIVRSIVVKIDGRPCRYLNELEWIEGELWANVWQTDQIVCIDPKTGNVKRILNLASVYPVHNRIATADVMNGIAYDSATQAIYITGKNWPVVYQIKLPD